MTDQSTPYQYKTVPVQKVKNEPVAEMNLMLENLDKFTKYSITIQAYNKLGTGPKTLPEIVAKTDEDGKQGEYTGGQSPYFIPYKDDICFIWLVVAWYALLWLAVANEANVVFGGDKVGTLSTCILSLRVPKMFGW